MEREGAAVTCDGRLFHRQAAATGNTLSSTVDRRVRRTSRDVDEAERSRRLASVSAGQRHTATLGGGRPRKTLLSWLLETSDYMQLKEPLQKLVSVKTET